MVYVVMYGGHCTNVNPSLCYMLIYKKKYKSVASTQGLGQFENYMTWNELNIAVGTMSTAFSNIIRVGSSGLHLSGSTGCFDLGLLYRIIQV